MIGTHYELRGQFGEGICRLENVEFHYSDIQHIVLSVAVTGRQFFLRALPRGSALHRAAGEVRAPGDLREQRKAELGVVLGSIGLGWLHTPLLEAGIRSLASLKSRSLEGVLSVLTGGIRQRAAVGAVRQQLQSLGLHNPSGDAPMQQHVMRD